jgi:hypothetical protein
MISPSLERKGPTNAVNKILTNVVDSILERVHGPLGS